MWWPSPTCGPVVTIACCSHMFAEQFAFCFPSECQVLGTAVDHLVATNKFQLPGKQTGTKEENPKSENGACCMVLLALDPAPHRFLCVDLSVHSQVSSAHLCKWICLGTRGSICAQMDPSMHTWIHPCTCGSICAQLDPSMHMWIHLCTNGPIHSHMDPSMHKWTHPCICGSIRAHMDMSTQTWICPGICGPIHALRSVYAHVDPSTHRGLSMFVSITHMYADICPCTCLQTHLLLHMWIHPSRWICPCTRGLISARGCVCAHPC